MPLEVKIEFNYVINVLISNNEVVHLDKSLIMDHLDHSYGILIWQTNLLKIIQRQENFVQARQLCPVVVVITLVHSAYHPVTVILKNSEEIKVIFFSAPWILLFSCRKTDEFLLIKITQLFLNGLFFWMIGWWNQRNLKHYILALSSWF